MGRVQKRYQAELRENEHALSLLKDQCQNGKVTLLYGAKDEEHNRLVVLKEYLENHE
jgi:uncharacterized protein YeaO (DUF488 family)